MNLTKINTEKLAELVGILLGDGYLSSSTNRVKISFNSKDDAKYITYVDKLLAGLFDVKPILKQRVNENTAELYIFKRDIIGFLINNMGIKVSPKWNNATIPSQFLSSKLDLQVLKGYFDTDGCLVTTNNNGTIYPRLEMKISPSPMQKQFMNILKKYKFSSKKINNQDYLYIQHATYIDKKQKTESYCIGKMSKINQIMSRIMSNSESLFFGEMILFKLFDKLDINRIISKDLKTLGLELYDIKILQSMI